MLFYDDNFDPPYIMSNDEYNISTSCPVSKSLSRGDDDTGSEESKKSDDPKACVDTSPAPVSRRQRMLHLVKRKKYTWPEQQLYQKLTPHPCVKL